MITPTDYLRLAVDPVRLGVLGRAAIGPVDSAQLARALRVSRKRVLAAIGQLTKAGLLDREGRLDREALQQLAASLGKPAAFIEGPWTPEEAEILSRFFEGTRLREVPASRSKRLIVLERLAREFEIGVRYRERQVNSMLQLFHSDYASLRRYLVDEEFLSREAGVYWRSGGRT